MLEFWLVAEVIDDPALGGSVCSFLDCKREVPRTNVSLVEKALKLRRHRHVVSVTKDGDMPTALRQGCADWSGCYLPFGSLRPLCPLRPFGSLGPWWTRCPDGCFRRGTGDRHDTRGQSPAAIILMALELDFLAGSECIEGLRATVNR